MAPPLDFRDAAPKQTLKSQRSESFTNPLWREHLIAGNPDNAYRRAVADVNHRVIEFVRAAYKSDRHNSFLTNHGEIDRIVALAAPAVEAGQLQIAQLTNAHLAELFGLKDVPAPDLSKLGRDGVTVQQELARPLWTAIKAAREGKPIEEALSLGERRMERMLQTDMQLAKVKQSREALKASEFRTYQRIAGPNACWLCSIAATQTYYTGDLLPIHPGCGCDVAPMPPGGQKALDKKLDPEHVLSEDASQIKLMTPMVESDAPAKDYRDLITVREHGETGPTLTWAHQKFTGPADLPTPPSKEVLSQEVYDTVRANGGITIDLAGNQPHDGYAYAPYKTTEFKVKESEFTPKHVDDYIDAHHAELARKGNNLGMWVQDGYVYLDVSKVGPPTVDTFAKAQAAHQLAVFDLGNFNEIQLGTIDEKGYHSLGAPADLHRQYREQVARADEAGRAGSLAEVPGSESGSRRGAKQTVKWTGPPVARPSYGGDIQDEVDFDWGAKKTYDKHKDAMREGAHKAQREGYPGVPQHLRSLGRQNYEDDAIEMHGEEMVARAVHATPTKRNLWRGMEVTPDQLSELVGSTRISLPLSAFGRDADEARLFSVDVPGRTFRSSSVPDGATGSVILKLQPGAKLAPIFYGHEYVGFGQFDVLSVKPAHWGTQGTGEYRKKIWRPTEITIKQTSMIEADIVDATPGSAALKAKAHKQIPEFTIVGERGKQPQFGTIDLKTGAINRSGDYITKVQPGPIPDYDNSYAVSTQLHARHPDLDVRLGSMIDGGLARSTAQAVDDMMTKYPAAQLRSVESRSPYNFQHSTRYAQTDVFDPKILSGTKIEFNDSFYMRKADLEKSYAKTVAANYHPDPGKHDAAYAIATHEFGHTMDASGSYYASNHAKDALRHEFLRTHPQYRSATGIVEELGVRQKYDEWLTEQLSDYATRSGRSSGITRLPGDLNPSEAIAEAFAHVELDPENATDAERALHKLVVDSHTRPYDKKMTAPRWLMADASPVKVVDAKEAKRVAVQAKKEAAAAEKTARAAEREAKHAAAQAKKAEAAAIKAKKEEQGFGDVKKRIPHGTEIQPIRTARGTLDKKGTWDSVSDETLRENWRAALRDSDKFAWESGKVWYSDLNQLCTNLASTYGANFRANWGVDLTPDLVAGIMSSYSTNNGWAMNLVGVEQFLSGTAKLNKLAEPTAMHFQNKDWGVKPLLSYLRSGKGTVVDYYAENLSAPKPFNFLKSIKGDEDAACVDRWVSRIMLHTNDYKFADEMWAAESKEGGRYGFQRMRQAILDVANEPEFAGYTSYMLQAIPWVQVNGGDLAVANLDVGELFTASKAEHSATEVTKLLNKESHRRGWS